MKNIGSSTYLRPVPTGGAGGGVGAPATGASPSSSPGSVSGAAIVPKTNRSTSNFAMVVHSDFDRSRANELGQFDATAADKLGAPRDLAQHLAGKVELGLSPAHSGLLKMPNHSPNRHNGVVRYVASVQEGLDLAWHWQANGKADWFRGQVFPWPPRSSLARWRQQQERGETWSSSPALFRFLAWAERLPEMSTISNDESKLTAIAQHFGIPTDFVDFSVSPDVAALFSRDCPTDTVYQSGEACIYCLNYDVMFDWWKSIPQDEAEQLQISPVTIDLPELHRLSAQHGCFLHAPCEWYTYFEPDRIIFPRGPSLTSEERLSIYPPTSKLEEDLQAFVQANSTDELAEFVERSRGAVVHLKLPQTIRDSCFIGKPSRRSDWPDEQDQWVQGRYTPSKKPFTIQWPQQTTKMGNLMLAAASRVQLEETLEQHPHLWEIPLQFDIAATPALLDERAAAGTTDALTRAWNGMAAFPYSRDQRLDCFERTLVLGSGGLGLWVSELDAKLRRMLSQPPDNLDRWIEVSLGARNNAWSKGLLSLTELASALGENIEEVLSSDGRVLASRDPLELIRRVRDPALIFNFQRLTNCFAQNLIPTQALLQPADLPLVFSPGQLSDFWPTLCRAG